MLYRAKTNGDIGIKGIKVIGEKTPLGYEKTADFFVDNSGFGSESEPALTFDNFLKQVKQGFYYGITSSGQFQVNIAEFQKIKKSRAEIFSEQGILSSKLISKSCRIINYLNGDLKITLYATDILQIKGGKIILNSGGYLTRTTKARMNQFLPINIDVYQKKHKWYIDNKGEILEFFDNIELDILNKE